MTAENLERYRSRSTKRLEAIVAEHVRAEEAWYRDKHLAYAKTVRGTCYHLIGCRVIIAGVRAAERGEVQHPVRLSLADAEQRRLDPCEVCLPPTWRPRWLRSHP